jgi:hypothetical protein
MTAVGSQLGSPIDVAERIVSEHFGGDVRLFRLRKLGSRCRTLAADAVVPAPHTEPHGLTKLTYPTWAYCDASSGWVAEIKLKG